LETGTCLKLLELLQIPSFGFTEMNLGQFKTGGMEQRDHAGPIAYINQSYIIALTVLV
jgi:hypothetical protein